MNDHHHQETDTTRASANEAFLDYLRALNRALGTAIAPTLPVRCELSRLAAGGWPAERLAGFLRASHSILPAAGIVATLPAIPTQPVDHWTPPAAPIPPGYYRDDELAAGAGIHHHGLLPHPDTPPATRQPAPCCGRLRVHTTTCHTAPNQVIADGTR